MLLATTSATWVHNPAATNRDGKTDTQTYTQRTQSGAHTLTPQSHMKLWRNKIYKGKHQQQQMSTRTATRSDLYVYF